MTWATIVTGHVGTGSRDKWRTPATKRKAPAYSNNTKTKSTCGISGERLGWGCFFSCILCMCSKFNLRFQNVQSFCFFLFSEMWYSFPTCFRFFLKFLNFHFRFQHFQSFWFFSEMYNYRFQHVQSFCFLFSITFKFCFQHFRSFCFGSFDCHSNIHPTPKVEFLLRLS